MHEPASQFRTRCNESWQPCRLQTTSLPCEMGTHLRSGTDRPKDHGKGQARTHLCTVECALPVMEPLLGVAWGVAVVVFDDMIGGQQPRRTIAGLGVRRTITA